jgi:hypothetical protein
MKAPAGRRDGWWGHAGQTRSPVMLRQDAHCRDPARGIENPGVVFDAQKQETGMSTSPNQVPLTDNEEGLRFLAPALVRRIDEALRRVGEFGEVRLIVVKGELRFIEIVTSENIHQRV